MIIGDLGKILRNKRISAGLLGAGIGSGAGYLIGDRTGWYDPWKGALAGGIVGTSAAFLPRKIKEEDVIKKLEETKAFNTGLGLKPSALSGMHIPNDGYWIAPSIGGTLLGLAGTASVTDNPYAIAAGGIAGLVGGNALDRYMLTHTQFPTFK